MLAQISTWLLVMYVLTPMPRIGITPEAGMLLNTYAAGTTTPLDTFSDASGSHANDNPVQSNGLGLFPAVYLPVGTSYKFVFTHAVTNNEPPDPVSNLGSIIFTQDGVGIGSSSGFFNVLDYGTDGEAVQSAVNACGAAGGGFVFAPPGTYRFSTTLLIQSSNIEVIGAGAGRIDDNTSLSNAATTFQWGGAPGGILAIAGSASGSSNYLQSRIGIRGIRFLGQNALRLLEVRSLAQGMLNDLTFIGGTDAAIYIGVVATLNGSTHRDTQNCVFDNLGIDTSTSGGIGILFDGDHAIGAGTANTSYNRVSNLLYLGNASPGLKFLSADNNVVYDARCFMLDATKPSIVFTLPAGIGSAYCTANLLYHPYAAGTGVVQLGGATGNEIDCLDYSQGGSGLTITTGTMKVTQSVNGGVQDRYELPILANGGITTTTMVENSIAVLANPGATPTISSSTTFYVTNAAPANITDLLGGVVGKTVRLNFGDANTTLVDGGNLYLAGNFVSQINATIILHTTDGTVWREDCRSMN